MAGVVVCAAFAVAGIGVSRGDEGESLWGTSAWLAAVLVAGAGVRLAISRWAPHSNEILLGLVGLLIGIGWVVVVRTDPALAQSHSIAVLAGFGALAGTLVAMGRLDWCLHRPGVLGLVAVALAGLGTFSAGVDVSGGAYDPARQWLDLGSLSLQPYGLAKPAAMLAACALTVSAPRWLPARLVPHRHVVGAMTATVGAWALLIAGGDLGSAVVIFAAAWLPLWLDDARHLDASRPDAGHSGMGLPTASRSVRTRALGGIAATFGVGVVVLASVYDWLSAQVRHWQDPWAAGGGAATVEAAFAMSAGGLSGVGPGLGLPDRIAAAHSDFVFAVVVEDLGILGGAAILAAFALFVGVGTGIAQRAQDTHRLLAAAITVVIGLQALLSIAGVLRLTPHTVGALPFMAHGPAAMMGSCIAVGMLLAVSHGSGSRRPDQPEPEASLPADLRLTPQLVSEPAPPDAPTGEIPVRRRRPARRRRRTSDPGHGEPQQLPLGDL